MPCINSSKVATSLRPSSIQRIIHWQTAGQTSIYCRTSPRISPSIRNFSATKPILFTQTISKMGVHNVADKSSFDTAVIEASKNKIVVVDFFATWCGPCKAIAPHIAAMSNEPDYADKVDFIKLDVDEVADVAADQGIRAMPTFGIFKDGEKIDEVIGADPRGLKAKIDALLYSIAQGIPYEKPAEPFNIMKYLPYLVLLYLFYTYMIAK